MPAGRAIGPSISSLASEDCRGTPIPRWRRDPLRRTIPNWPRSQSSWLSFSSGWPNIRKTQSAGACSVMRKAILAVGPTALLLMPARLPRVRMTQPTLPRRARLWLLERAEPALACEEGSVRPWLDPQGAGERATTRVCELAGRRCERSGFTAARAGGASSGGRARTAFIQDRIHLAEQMAEPSGPSEQDVAAASQMSPESARRRTEPWSIAWQAGWNASPAISRAG